MLVIRKQIFSEQSSLMKCSKSFVALGHVRCKYLEQGLNFGIRFGTAELYHF